MVSCRKKQQFGLAELAAVTDRSIKDAGDRYFLNKCPDFPDMDIEAFDEAVTGLIGGKDFRALVSDIQEDIQKGWEEVERANIGYQRMLPRPGRTILALESLAHAAPGGGDDAVARILKHAESAHKRTEEIEKRISQKQEKAHKTKGYWSDDAPRLAVSRYGDGFWRAMKFLPQEVFHSLAVNLPYMLANAGSVHKTGALILHSEWGMGKTHSLCHLAKKRQEKGAPVLLVLAKDFNPGKSPGNELARHTQLANNFKKLLMRLNALGKKAGERALLIVDGINENDSDGVWEKELENFLQQTLPFPFVGVIVSYRTPFNPVLSESIRPKLSALQHPGFEDISFEAQLAFMDYYGVRVAEIPPMSEECMRPLMLKIICECFRDLPEADQRKGFAGIASGQKGMTRILEHYIKARAEGVVNKHHNLSPRTIWQFVKNVMAPYMAEHLTEEVPARYLLNAMRGHFSVGLLQAKAILRDMDKEGIVMMRRFIPRKWLNSPVSERGEKPRRRMLVQMHYQRFSDHIIARHLLERHLKTHSAAALRRCFDANSPLGKMFTIDEHREAFRSLGAGDGIIEALILEFPERIKNMPGICPDEKELLFYLPQWRQKTGYYRGPFLRGLYWRPNSAVSRQTVNLVWGYFRHQAEECAKSNRPHFFGDMVETLLSSACRHSSPLSAAKLLYPAVKQTPMTRRDIVWGAAMRKARMEGWTNNLFVWLRHLDGRKFEGVKPAEAGNYIALLSTFLGSTDRPLRDNATKALVTIGEYFPAELFRHALDTLDFDDVYYPERMLAACYGVAMSQWADTKARKFHAAFSDFAHSVVKNIFMPGGQLLTHHAVVRDYVFGIAAVARKLGVEFSNDELRYMSRPYPAVSSAFPPATEIDESKFSEAAHAFTPDFHDRYTVPGISPRGEQREISRQVKWRVMDLGYTNEKFAGTEDAIRSNRWDERRYGKTDTCGKKYSWIAYHEMCGTLDAAGRLPDRVRSAGGILDVSFPTPPAAWTTDFKIPDMSGDDAWWLAKGGAPVYDHLLQLNLPDELPRPWVMLEGDVTHRNKNNKQYVVSFARGLLLEKGDVSRLQNALRHSAHPGNDIPLCVYDYTVFGSEIPWSPNFMDLHPETQTTAFNGIPVQTTVMHSKGNKNRSSDDTLMFSEAWYPVPDICDKLRLSRRGRGVDLVDNNGEPASLYRADAGQTNHKRFGEPQNNDFQFVYLRKDLLDKYLRLTGKQLVWVIWCERRIDYFQHTDETLAICHGHKNIHKKLVVYNPQN